jgi:major membrane immunogen (membrane-anchored lipoprotein)
MKQNQWFAFVLAGSMLVGSCGKHDEEIKEATESTQQNAVSSSDNNVSTANVETANAATATAVSASTLKSFLPTTLSGYKADGDGESMQATMSGFQYSVATQDYKNGEKSIKLVLADYNGVGSLTAGYSMLMGMSIETDKEVTKGEKFGGHQGWVNYHKDNSQAQIGIAVNDRIWLIVEGENGATIDELRSVVNAIDLAKLGNVK